MLTHNKESFSKKFFPNRYTQLLLILFFVFVVIPSKATHVAGVDLYYECIPNTNSYQIYVDFYRDCEGVSAPTSVTVNVSGVSCSFNQTSSLTALVINEEVSQLCPASIDNSTCESPTNPFPGVERITYSGTVDLDINYCSDFIFSITTCCRNEALSNLVNPGGQSVYLEVSLDNTSGDCANSSPQFLAQPTFYNCVGQTMTYNQGASDADGDSLVYSLCNALGASAPGGALTYAPGYNYNLPVSSSPVISLDPLTGALTMNPNIAQSSIVTICIEEWRTDTGTPALIGTTMRDIQIITLDHCNNEQPSVDSIQNIYADGVRTGSWSVELCMGDSIAFDFVATDANADNVSMSSNIDLAIPDADLSFTAMGSVVTGTFSWRPENASDEGLNYFVVEVTDDACPVLGKSYFEFSINVIDATFVGVDQTVCGDSVQLAAIGGDSFTWTAVPPGTTAHLSCTTCPNPKAFPPTTTQYIATSDLSGTCKFQDTITIFLPDPFTITPSNDTTVCLNGAAHLRVTPSPIGSYTFQWTPSSGLSEDTIQYPLAAPSSTQKYYVDVTSTSNCTVRDSIVVSIIGVAPIVEASALQDSICEQDSVQLRTAVSWTPACDTTTVIDCSSPSNTGEIGTTVSSSFTYSPYYGNGWVGYSNRKQYMYLQSELTALGMTGGSEITAIALNFADQGDAMSGLKVNMGCTSSPHFGAGTGMTSGYSFVGGMTRVIETVPTQPPVGGGWQVLTLDYPYLWNGSDNIVVEFCTDDQQLVGNGSRINYYQPPNKRCIYSNISSPNGCSEPTGIATNNLPIIQFTWCGTAPPDVTYQWEPTTGMLAGTDTLPNPKVAPSVTTTYAVTTIDPGFPGCPGTDFVTVYVGDTFSVAATILIDTICIGEPTQLFATPNVSGNYNYQWTPGNSLSDSTTQNPFSYPTSNTTYYLTVSNEGCTQTDSVKVVIKSPPSGMSITVTKDTLCTPETTQLSISGQPAGAIYSWTPASLLNDATINNPIASPITTTTFQVQVGDGILGCDTLLSYTIFAGEPFTVDAETIIEKVCPSSCTELQVTSASSFIFEYAWTPAATLSDTTLSNPMACPSDSTRYYALVSRPLYGCTVIDSIDVAVDGDQPYIVGGGGTNGIDSTVSINGNSFKVLLSEPIICDNIDASDFILGCGSTTTSGSCNNHNIINATGLGCSPGDTTSWITITLDSIFPSGYDNDWLLSISGTSDIVDTCGNIITPTGSEGASGSPTILPLELLFLKANLLNDKQHVSIEWKTAAEINIKNFKIEHSIDGIQFNAIAQKVATGNNSSYSCIHTQPQGGTNYYRLKIVEEDGLQFYSYTVAVELEESFDLIKLFPVPALNEINLVFNSRVKGDVQYEMIDILGRLVKSGYTQAEKGTNNLNLSMEDLKGGIYFMNLYYSKNSQNRLFVKVLKI